ncbi:MAG: Lrp/AsnC family transcriptional regulator [Chloroflexi bacterium]|nr:Lrp/AsnC family transcriptional regulator [Chloroflexota bacterium]
MPTVALDDTDRKILDLLQRDARMTNAAIAAEVGLTAPSVFERVRKLEQRGVIGGYTVRVDPAALGKTMTAFIRLTAATDEKYGPGIEAVSDDPDVLELYNVAGEDCFILKTRVGDPGDLHALLNRIRSRLTVTRSVTMIALAAIKEDGALNVLGAPAEAKPETTTRKQRNGK